MKNNLLVMLIAVTAALISSAAAYAHHSFAATYFVDQTVKIEGTITEFLYRNPHSYLKVEAPDDKGQMQTWAIEWASGAQLARDHVTRDMLKPNDHVIVTGNPGRDPAYHRIRMHSIARPSDGWKWEGEIQ